MGLAKRIIPCLDVDAGRVVKGVQFVDIRDAGDPIEIAKRYDREGADELTFLDITASSDNRDTIVSVVEAVASQVFIPLTVGGGIRRAEDVRRMLNAGADKVSIMTAAVQNPDLVGEASVRIGSASLVLAIDARRLPDDGSGGVLVPSDRAEGGERKLVVVGLLHPAGVVLRPEVHHQEPPCPRDRLHPLLEKGLTGRVHPVEVLDQRHARGLRVACLEDPAQHTEELPLPRLGIHRRGRTFRIGDAQEVEDHGKGLVERPIEVRITLIDSQAQSLSRVL